MDKKAKITELIDDFQNAVIDVSYKGVTAQDENVINKYVKARKKLKRALENGV